MQEQETQLANQQHFHNEWVDFQVTRLPQSITQFEVNASALLCGEAKKEAIKEVSKEVTLPGFRKGKAPENLVTKRYAAQIEQEWGRQIGRRALNECEAASSIKPLTNETKVSFKFKNHSNDGAQLSFQFETFPVIPEVDPRLFTLNSVESNPITSEVVDKMTRQIQMFFASWTDVKDRPIQEGDFVLLSVHDIEKDPYETIFDHVRFEVTKSSMATWMYDLILGHSAGEILEGVSTPDKDASKEDKEALKDKKVRVEINLVQTGVWPELDDAFAAKVGAKNVEELKSNVKQLLEGYGKEMVEENYQQQVASWLISTYAFDLPHQMVVAELNQRLREFSQQEEFVNYYHSLSEEEKKSMIDAMLDSSKNALRLALLTRQVLAQGKLKVEADEIVEKKLSPLDLLMRPLHQKSQGLLEASSPNQQYSKLLLKKAATFIMDHAPKKE